MELFFNLIIALVVLVAVAYPLFMAGLLFVSPKFKKNQKDAAINLSS